MKVEPVTPEEISCRNCQNFVVTNRAGKIKTIVVKICLGLRLGNSATSRSQAMTKDRYLTEKLLDKCWHEFVEQEGMEGMFVPEGLECVAQFATTIFTMKSHVCSKCKHTEYSTHEPARIDLTTPEGFFALWDAAKEKDWWDLFLIWTINLPSGCDSSERWVDWHINPLRFRDALYDFLKGRES